HHLLVADARYVTAYDLRTGEADNWYDAAADFGGMDANLKLPAPADLRYTLTAAEGCIFARLGAQELKPDNGESVLVCLGPELGSAGRRLRWYKQPRVKDRESAVYEGAPVVHDGRVYIAVT